MIAAADSPSVAAYHRTISAHLVSLLHSTTSASQLPKTVEETSSDPSTSASGSSASLSKVSSATSPDQTKETEAADDKEEENGDGQFTARPLSLPQLPDLVLLPDSSKSTEVVTVPTPPQTRATREAEHQAAWQSDGAKIYKSVPEGFNLVLDASRSRHGSASKETKPQGLGIDLTVTANQELALRMGLLSNRSLSKSPEPLLAPVAARKMASHDNLSVVSTSASVSASANPVTLSVSSFAKSSIPLSRNPQPVLSLGPRSTELRDVSQEEKDESYEMRRQMKLRKKEADLKKKIMQWREQVQIIDQNAPEIEPTPPTPSISSSQLRLSPFHPTMETLGSLSSNSTGRLRAIDALLGDMSLRPSKVTPLGSATLSLKPISHLGRSAESNPVKSMGLA